MQARAIFEAALDVASEGQPVYPEIMIPLVGTKKELDLQAALVRDDRGRRVRGAGQEGRLHGRDDDRGARAPR